MAADGLTECAEAVVERRLAPRRGRPPGATPLLRDPHRFETAAWLFAVEGLHLGPSTAAVAVAGLFSSRPFRAEAVSDLVMCISTGVDHATLKGKADRIRRRAAAQLLARTDADTTWLVESAGALTLLVLRQGDPGRAAYALDLLQGLGWGPTLAKIYGRLAEALRSNLPPAAEPMARAARRLHDVLAAAGNS